MTADRVVIVLTLLQIVIALFGFALNGYILLAIPFARLTIFNCLLLCLAVWHCLFDALVVTFDLIAIVHWFHLPSQSTIALDWPCSDSMFCRAHTSVWAIIPACNLWIISALVTDRYLVIVKPFPYESKLNRFKCIVLLLFVGLLLLLVALPFWVRLPPSSSNNCLFLSLNLSGALITESQLDSQIWITLIVGTYLLPTSIVLFCNVHLLTIIIDHRNRIVTTIYVVQHNRVTTCDTGRRKSSSSSSSTSSSTGSGRYRSQKDSLVTTLNLFCTLLLMLPYFINLVGQLAFHYFDVHLSAVTLLIVTFTPLVNGYIYGVRNQPIKKAFRRVLQRYLLEIRISNEIDQREIVRANHSKAHSLSSVFQSSNVTSGDKPSYETHDPILSDVCDGK